MKTVLNVVFYGGLLMVGFILKSFFDHEIILLNRALIFGVLFIVYAVGARFLGYLEGKEEIE